MSIHKSQFDLIAAKQYLPHIILIGLGLGTANYFMNTQLNWLQSCVIAVINSMIIGYTTSTIALNRSWWKNRMQTPWQLAGVIGMIFMLSGFFSIEIEHSIRSLVFQTEPWEFFSSGKMYLFNGIIALVLGYSFFYNNNIVAKGSKSLTSENANVQLDQEISEDSQTVNSTISNVPVKQGEKILLVPINEVVYFEAFDNYAFVYAVNGNKKLCDYSLSFLEKRLEENFKRVHRKYLINTSFVQQITPHLNGRYIIEFNTKSIGSITSSKTYSKTVRSLIKIH